MNFLLHFKTTDINVLRALLADPTDAIIFKGTEVDGAKEKSS